MKPDEFVPRLRTTACACLASAVIPAWLLGRPPPIVAVVIALVCTGGSMLIDIGSANRRSQPANEPPWLGRVDHVGHGPVDAPARDVIPAPHIPVVVDLNAYRRRSTGREIQCPACASFAVAALTDGLHQCSTCGQRWAWTPGRPAPATRIDPAPLTAPLEGVRNV
jgi:hypothetical protein